MNRRTLLAGAAYASALGPASFPFRRARAAAAEKLNVVSRTIEVNGRAATVLGLTDAGNKPGLILDAGSMFDIVLDNKLAEDTMIHWHGLTPPAEFDGVPDLPMPIIKAGEQRAYRFPVGAGGTHWMHAHTLQEQQLLAAPLIVRTTEDRKADEQEVVVLLHDFSFTPPAELLAGLKGSAGSAKPGMDHGVASHGNSDGGMAGMDMSGMDMGSDAGVNLSVGAAGMDLNDIEYDAYLANDRTLDDPEVVQVERGGRVRLRIINGATATGFTIDLNGLTGKLLAVDGQAIVPLEVRQVPLTMGQRADIRIDLPKEGGAFPIVALREGSVQRTGIVLATPGAKIAGMSTATENAGPVLDLSLESRIQAQQTLVAKAADRKLTVHLVGNMAGYTWAMGGDSLKIRSGERITLEMMNMSMMAHPMHLHGHHFQIVGIGGKAINGAVRDTVLVPPNQSVTIAFDAKNPAKAWAFHCHHLYHMAAGMITTVAYDGI